ncbi:MAG: calcineurin-like phosphoesterase C-terminal domain-containing protein [Bacteroidales bacterium]|nr:calcineurin-like phosphoesterase C-terminal domain-containing protein [Bacteroidales bacterium]
MKKLLTFIIAAGTVISADAVNIKGTVKTTDGAGLAGVVVSDGLNTVLTDEKGRWEMDADEDSRFVFISTPSGYISSTLEGPTLFYKEIAKDTGRKKKSYDFLVQANPKDDTNHNVIVIADPQISERNELPELEKHSDDITQFVKGMDGDYTFGLCLGDIVGWDHSIYPEYNRIMGKAGFEYRYVIGNHDMTNYGRSHETSMRNYEDIFGPCWYSFNVGKVHYIVLNDNFFVGRDWYYIGYLDERQLRWLENDLSYIPEGSQVVVSMHIPTTLDKSDREAFSTGTMLDNLSNKPALYQMLLPYQTLILSGHMHTADYEQIAPNIAEINIAGLCGAWWCGEVCIDGSPAGYKIFDMDGDKVEWIYKGCGHPLDYQMKVYADDPSYPEEIIANVWDYDPAWKVEYFEDGKKVCDMERFKAQDPLAKELYKDPASLKRTWVYAAPTENMFRAKRSVTAQTLEVRVTDRFGRVYSKKIER